MVSFKRLMKWCAIGVVTCVLGWSLLMQVYVNSLDYFSFLFLRASLEQFKQERVDDYFNNCFHRGLINRDLIRYIEKGKPYFPVEVVKSKSVLSPLHRDRLSELTNGIVWRGWLSRIIFSVTPWRKSNPGDALRHWGCDTLGGKQR
jgi:hypothetical protein